MSKKQERKSRTDRSKFSFSIISGNTIRGKINFLFGLPIAILLIVMGILI